MPPTSEAPTDAELTPQQVGQRALSFIETVVDGLKRDPIILSQLADHHFGPHRMRDLEEVQTSRDNVSYTIKHTAPEDKRPGKIVKQSLVIKADHGQSIVLFASYRELQGGREVDGGYVSFNGGGEGAGPISVKSEAQLERPRRFLAPFLGTE